MDSRTQLTELVESARKQLEAIQDLIKSPSMFEAVTAQDNSLITQAWELTSVLRSAGRLHKLELSTNLPIIAQEFAVERIGTPPSQPIPIPQAPRRRQAERTRSCPLDVLKSPLLEVTERRNLKRTRSVEPASSNMPGEFTLRPAKFGKFDELPSIEPRRLFADAIESEATERRNLKRAREQPSDISQITDVSMRPVKFRKYGDFPRVKPTRLLAYTNDSKDPASSTRSRSPVAADFYSISTPRKALDANPFMEAPAKNSKRSHKRISPPKAHVEASRVSKRLLNRVLLEHAASTASAAPPVKIVENPHLQWRIMRRCGSNEVILRGEPLATPRQTTVV